MLHQLLYTLCRIFLILMSYDDCSDSNSFHLSAIFQQLSIRDLRWLCTIKQLAGIPLCVISWVDFHVDDLHLLGCDPSCITAIVILVLPDCRSRIRHNEWTCLSSSVTSCWFCQLQSLYNCQPDNFPWSKNNDVFCLHSLVVTKTLCRVQFRLRLQSDVTAQWLDRNWYISPL